MSDLSEAVVTASRLIMTLDADLVEVVVLSLRVSLTAVVIAALIGLPLGATLAVARFPGRRALIVLINTLMGLPPVVAGLIVYLLLSNSGPLGVLQLLYTPGAMIAAQTLLITPIVAALARQTVKDLRGEFDEQLRAFGLSPFERMQTLLYEGRARLATALLAGFGRAIGEVGAIIIVGGNINHLTRTMTTAIALETSRGNLAMALALGFILVTLALLINILVLTLRPMRQHAGLYGARF
ncbi:MAG: ABC transporter permease [Hyphomicrobium sp.]|mgnify:CR=1 FL=1